MRSMLKRTVGIISILIIAGVFIIRAFMLFASGLAVTVLDVIIMVAFIILIFLHYRILSRNMRKELDLEEKISRKNDELMKFQAAMEQGALAIVILNNQWIVTYASQTVAAICEEVPNEIIGTHISVLFPDITEDVLLDVQETVDRGSGWESEITSKPDEEEKWLSIHMSRITDNCEKKAGYVLFASDETDRHKTLKELDDNRKFLESLINNSTASIFVKDIQDRYLIVNKAWCETFQLSPINVIGKTSYEVFGHNRFSQPDENKRIVERGAKITREDHAVFRGKARFFLTQKFPIYDSSGKVKAVCGIASEISKLKEAEKAIQEKEEKLRFSLEAIGAYYWIYDNQKEEITFDSELFLAQFGYDETQHTISVKRFAEIIPEDDLESVRYAFREHGNGENQIFRVEYRIQKSDGEYAWLQSIGRAIEWDEKGRSKRIAGLTFDVTERKIAEIERTRSEMKLKALFEALPVGASMIDEEGHIVEANKLSEDILGISVSEHKSRTLSKEQWSLVDTHGVQLPVEEYPAYIALEEGRVVKDVVMGMRNGTGRIVWLSVSAAPIENNVGGGVAIAFQDITSKFETQNALGEAKKEAEMAAQAKSEFLANMSHEIRTPLNAIVGLISLLGRTSTSPRQLDYLDKINHATSTLLRIINDILDFSKIEAGKLKLEHIPFEIDEVLDGLSSVIGLAAFQKRLEFVILKNPNVPRVLIGDPLRLGQILMNLCYNSLKFTSKGEVLLSVEHEQVDDDNTMIKFTVKDTGVGMTDEQMDNLFEAFTQADTSTTREYGGTGLGLAICKQLVDMMDGTIHVSSDYGEGTTFIVQIPLGIDKTKQQKVITEPSAFAALRVAVVEDNETARKVYENYLSDQVDLLYWFKSGEELLNNAKSLDIDLLILDYKLPGKDGLVTWKEYCDILGDRKQPNLLVVTAYGTDQVQEQAVKSGIQHMITKPITQSSLYDAMLAASGQGVLFCDESNGYDICGTDLSEYTILLVEDNDINRDIITELLEPTNVRIETAVHGEEAIRLIQGSKTGYDLILMDLQMPMMDGFTAAREIRKRFSSEELPIIALSADAMESTISRIHDVGMQAHIAKPIDVKELVNAIRRFMGDSKGNKALEVYVQEPKTREEDPLALFDKSKALKRLLYNERAYNRLLSRFKKKYADLEVQIDATDTQNDLRRIFHSLKGLAGNVGLTKVADICAELESRVLHEAYTLDDLKGDKSYQQLRTILQKSIKQIDTYFELYDQSQSANESDQEILDRVQLEARLQLIDQMLIEQDVSAIHVFEKLRASFVQMKWETQYKQIEACLAKFDFRSAHRLFVEVLARFEEE